MRNVHGGPTNTARPAGLGAWIIRALPCPQYTGRGKQRCIDPRKPLVLKLIGYYTRGSRPDGIRLHEYEAWKKHVRKSAPPLPVPSASKPVRIDVWCYFATGTHADPENVRKGIVDALFPDGDKWVFGYHHHPLYSKAPHALVEISEMKG